MRIMLQAVGVHMNMPGFTAEYVLYRNHDRYVSRMNTVSKQHVIPQKINDTCWMNRFERTYFRCVSIGYDIESCMQVAAGLADSVCDF